VGAVGPPSSWTSTRTQSADVRTVTVIVPPFRRELLWLTLLVTSSDVSRVTRSVPG
jgi:hypothetical protein